MEAAKLIGDATADEFSERAPSERSTTQAIGVTHRA